MNPWGYAVGGWLIGFLLTVRYIAVNTKWLAPYGSVESEALAGVVFGCAIGWPVAFVAAWAAALTEHTAEERKRAEKAEKEMERELRLLDVDYVDKVFHDYHTQKHNV